MIEIDTGEIWETATRQVVVHWRAQGYVYCHSNLKGETPTVADFHRLSYVAFNRQLKKAKARKTFPS